MQNTTQRAAQQNLKKSENSWSDKRECFTWVWLTSRGRGRRVWRRGGGRVRVATAAERERKKGRVWPSHSSTEHLLSDVTSIHVDVDLHRFSWNSLWGERNAWQMKALKCKPSTYCACAVPLIDDKITVKWFRGTHNYNNSLIFPSMKNLLPSNAPYSCIKGAAFLPPIYTYVRIYLNCNSLV